MSDYIFPTISATQALDGTYVLVDVRKAAARAVSQQGIASANWIDPFDLKFGHAVHEAPGPVAYFCAHGHEISTYATAMAVMAGQDAYMVRGGFDALCAAGAKTEALA